jgi:hypothetical protein
MLFWSLGIHASLRIAANRGYFLWWLDNHFSLFSLLSYSLSITTALGEALRVASQRLTYHDTTIMLASIGAK